MTSYTISNLPMGDAVPEAVIGIYLWEENGYTPRASADRKSTRLNSSHD